jgi:aryl-alcohol dehydrogenase-like predicted oxidoreductase
MKITNLVTQGKILYAGVSEWTAQQLDEALRIADKYLLDRIIVNQPIYNMLNRYIEADVVPFSEKSCLRTFWRRSKRFWNKKIEINESLLTFHSHTLNL